MGLVKAASSAAETVLADQWKEYVYGDALNNDTLVCRGYKRTGSSSSNTSGSAGIITSGSKIAVNEGQCMLLVENGKIIDFCAEPGAYIFQSDTEPSLFDGGWRGLKESFKKWGARFTYGGQPENDIRVYYVNTKEITDNKFGIGQVPFRDSEFGFTVLLKGYGTYSFRISDPIVFYSHLSGNVSSYFPKKQIEEQLRAEFQNCLQTSLGQLAALNISYDKIPFHTKELAKTVDNAMDEQWRSTRGITMESVGFSSLTPEEESVKKIAQFQEARVYTNMSMLGGRLGAAQASAMESAAANESGAVNGFVGVGLAQQAGGSTAAQFLAAGTQGQGTSSAPAAARPASSSWTCVCGQANSGKFCSECGTPRPTGCTHKNASDQATFCPDCGAKLK